MKNCLFLFCFLGFSHGEAKIIPSVFIYPDVCCKELLCKPVLTFKTEIQVISV